MPACAASSCARSAWLGLGWGLGWGQWSVGRLRASVSACSSPTARTKALLGYQLTVPCTWLRQQQRRCGWSIHSRR